MPQRAENHEAPLVLEVERFEHAAAGPERVLLRIDGRYGDRPGKRVLDAMLFVDDGLAVHRHAPVGDPAPAVDSWLWRAAFDVPVAYLTDERTRFALESQPGCLIELSHPHELLSGRGAVPMTARAAHVARRYAVAIAVMLTVAVTPGGIPASARTDVLRVHNPDGSVVYMTRDGQTLASLPADAVIVDQPAAPQAAGVPQPPATQPQPPVQAPPAKWDAQQADGGVTGLAEATRKQQRDAKPKAKPQTHTAPRRGHAPQPVQPQPHAPAPQVHHPAKPKPKPKHHKHPRHPHAHHAAAPEVQQQAPTAGDSLQQMPALLAAPGSDDVKLQSLNRVADTAHGEHTGREVQTGALPGKDFQSLGALGQDGHTSAPPPTTAIPTVETAPPLVPIDPEQPPAPQSTDGRKQHRTRDHRHAPAPQPTQPQKPAAPKAPLQHSDGTPTASNPTFVDALPGPATPGAVPDFVISKFRVPPFLLPIYQAAGIQYGIRWEVLAAINEIETDYGRNLNVSSAGALGWMQFMPATWRMYGTDANHDHKKDPFNPVDAIFASARYLKAAGGDKDIRRAVFAYNHAGWYVDSVMLRARLIAGYPPDLIGSLTGLTEGRFPVAAHAKYAEAKNKRELDIYTRRQAPVVAVNDGVVKKIGNTKSKGRYVVLQDVYGNQYTYSHLGSVAKLHPVPKKDAKAASEANVKAVGANDPKPTAPASAGAQRPATPQAHAHAHAAKPRKLVAPKVTAPAPVAAIKKRFFAHPQRPAAQRHGGFEQVLDSQAKGFETYDSYFTRPLGLNSRNATLRRLKPGSHVLASTVLGRVGGKQGKEAPHLRFEIRPAGKGAPKIDPKPIVDGWKLLESTAIYRAKGRNVLYGDGNFSIGEVMLLPKPLLAKRVLSDPRINIYPGGREDIRTGQIDRRVLVVLEYLAESGLNPTVSCLKSGHSLMTASGNISEHSSGNAVDISAINGTPILGHQEPGGITEQTVRRLMLLQGTMQPHQIISLLNLGGNTMSLPDHANHIHVGFHPLFGDNKQLGREAMSVLEPRQWNDLVQRLGQIDNPTVPTKPSKYAIPDRKGDL